MGLLDIFSNSGKYQRQTADTPNYKLSPMPSNGGIIKTSRLGGVDNLDETVGEVITSIRVGLGGDLVAISPAGKSMPYLALGDGETIYGKFAYVSSSEEISGVTVTTTCDDITYGAGES